MIKMMMKIKELNRKMESGICFRRGNSGEVEETEYQFKRELYADICDSCTGKQKT